MNVLVWLRRDLRLDDHAALHRAAALGRVLPLYLIDPEDWSDGAGAGRQFAFLRECLEELSRDLQALGAPLVVRVGATVPSLARLVRTYGIERVLVLEGGAALPEGLEAALQIPLERVPSSDCGPLPPLAPIAGVSAGMIPTAKSLGLGDDPCPHRQQGGRAAARAQLARHLRKSARAQGTAPDPLCETASSRLSAYLAWGSLSEYDIARAELGAGTILAGLRLRRRAVATDLAEGWGPQAHRQAFAKAETGIPIIDAGLRAFRATGWASAPLRALLASFAHEGLGLAPCEIYRALGALAVDHDPRLARAALSQVLGHRPPKVQGFAQRHDPEGLYLRRWLPELAQVPLPHLHAPWRWSGAGRVLGRRYPEPLLNPFRQGPARSARLGGGIALAPAYCANLLPPAALAQAQLAFDL